MFEIVKAWFESARLDKIADEMYLSLLHVRQLHGGNTGIDIDRENPADWAIAQRVVKRHPDVQVVAMGGAFTLVMRTNLESGVSSQMMASLRENALVGTEAVQMSAAEAYAEAHKQKRLNADKRKEELAVHDERQREHEREIAKKKEQLDQELIKSNPAYWGPILGGRR